MDTVIAAMEANHPHLTTQKSFYVEISRARDRAELVTDDRAGLKEQLEAVTGERISALEGIGEAARLEAEREERAQSGTLEPHREVAVERFEPSPEIESVPEPVHEKTPEPEPPVQDMEMDMGLEL